MMPIPLSPTQLLRQRPAHLCGIYISEEHSRSYSERGYYPRCTNKPLSGKRGTSMLSDIESTSSKPQYSTPKYTKTRSNPHGTTRRKQVVSNPIWHSGGRFNRQTPTSGPMFARSGAKTQGCRSTMTIWRSWRTKYRNNLEAHVSGMTYSMRVLF